MYIVNIKKGNENSGNTNINATNNGSIDNTADKK